MTLADNLNRIRARMDQAIKRSRRDPNSVHLLAVTKYVDASVIEQLAQIGITEVGENRVQSLVEKRAQVKAPLHWHLIGSLQKNKARKALQLAERIHSVDSLELLQTLDRIAGELGQTAKLFCEVNISGEESKHGFSPNQLIPFLHESKNSKNAHVVGLMTMAPHSENAEASRPIFRQLREIRDQAAKLQLFEGPGELSMGMTQDFEVAIEEGANWLRVGSALFEGIPLQSSA